MPEKNNSEQSYDDHKNLRRERIEEILESWRTAAAFSLLALKSAILLNGAAAGGLLTFLATQSKADGKIVQASDAAMAALNDFVIGAFAAVIATAFAYFCAYFENRSLWAWVERRKKWEKFWTRGIVFFYWLAMITVLYAYWRFWSGVANSSKLLGPVT